MRFSPLMLAMAILLQLFGSLQSANADEDWAKKMFSDHTHDYGVVARGAETVHRVKIKNLYQQTVHITSVTTSCSCTIAKVEKRTLKSLEEAELVIEIDTKKFMRQKNTTVSITFDSPLLTTVRYPISVYIRTDVVLTPGSANFGRVDQGVGSKRKINLAYAGRANWKVRSVETDSKHIKATVVETKRENSTVVYDIEVTTKETMPLGNFRGQVTLITDDLANPRVPVLVEGSVVPDIIVNPSVVSLGILAPGQTKTVNVVMRGKKPFLIKDISCDSGKNCFAAKYTANEKVLHVIPLTITSPEKEGVLNEQFTVKVEGRTEPLVFKAYGKVVLR